MCGWCRFYQLALLFIAILTSEISATTLVGQGALNNYFWKNINLLYCHVNLLTLLKKNIKASRGFVYKYVLRFILELSFKIISNSVLVFAEDADPKQPYLSRF